MFDDVDVVRFKNNLPFTFNDRVVLLWSYDDKLVLVHAGNPTKSINEVKNPLDYYDFLDSLGVKYENFAFPNEKSRDRAVRSLISEGFKRVEFYD